MIRVPQEAVGNAWGNLYVEHNGRICPMHTLAVDACREQFKSSTYKGYTADQCMMGQIFFSDTWDDVAPWPEGMTLVPVGLTSEEWQNALDYLAMDLVEGKNVDAYETLGRIRQYQQKQFTEQNPDGVMPSENQFRAEHAYMNIPYTMPFAGSLLVIGIVLFFMRRRPIAGWVNAIAWVFLSTMIGMRWYILGHAPMTSGHETLQLMAWMALGIGMCIACRDKRLSASMLIVAGATTLVSGFGMSHPELTAIMPALNSRWLCFHVSVIMMSYALFFLTWIQSIYSLWKPSEENERLCRRILVPACILLGVGIVMGSLWAKQAWGSYWQWDPKETWALITLIIYSVGLFLRPKNRRWFFAYLTLAFLSVLMTYFGVNYILGGMHSYIS